MFIALPLLAGERPSLKVEMADDGKHVRIQVFPSKLSDTSLLELLDDATGDCVRTIHAGTFSDDQVFFLPRNRGVKPGRYRVRLRQGIGIEVDKELAPPGGGAWVNPCDIALTDKALYVLDSGRTKARRVKEGPDPEEIVEVGGTFLYKFLRDGSLDSSFADSGRLTIRDRPSAIRSFAVDDAGLIYLPLGGHYIKPRESPDDWGDRTVVGGYNAVDGWTTVPGGAYHVEIWDGSGKRLPRAIGGYMRGGDPDFYTPRGRNTQNVNSVTLGPGMHIYLHVFDYGVIRAYDRTKNGLDGALYSTTQHALLGGSLPRCIASDRNGAIYLGAAGQRILKIRDDGKELKAVYASEPEARMVHPTGPSVSGDLVWVAANGPGEPFWDTGGGGAVFLFWDTGDDLRRVADYGKPGTSREGLEFLNPAATAASRDRTGLWVAEDGMANAEGPPGNARVRHFKITATRSEEAPFTWK